MAKIMLDEQHSSGSAQEIYSEQIRDWTRFHPEVSSVWLIAENQRKNATAFDESYGGIGLIVAMADAADIHLGGDVTVLYYGYPTRGRVQWIQQDQEAKLVRLGIQWSKS